MTTTHRAFVEDTYAEGFRSIYAEVLITARDRVWLDHACNAATGHASSSIFCECEAGIDRYVGPGGDETFATPDGRPGAIVQFHVPRFKKDREKLLEKVLLHRLSQNVLTCPTAISNWVVKSRCSATAINFEISVTAARCGSYRSWVGNSSSIGGLDSPTE